MSDQTSSSKDNWAPGDYQHSASYVPKLATKIIEWLDLQKNDVVLDIGCGDGILDIEFSKILSQGSGSLCGIDSSPSMIQAAQDLCKSTTNTTFKVLDVTKLSTAPEFQVGTFTKAFSNAALHWILAAPLSRLDVFRSIAAALKPGGTFALEMGGLGNISEMRTALLLVMYRRLGHLPAEPWFFPDEEWITDVLKGAGFRVDRVEREWRPTKADEGGVEGWIRLFGKQIIDQIEYEDERENAVREAVEVLREVCKAPGGGEMISYVRLRALATKI